MVQRKQAGLHGVFKSGGIVIFPQYILAVFVLAGIPVIVIVIISGPF